MKVVIETHCHSHYSHDSNLAIERIAEMGRKHGLTHIVVCDHDVCNKTPEDRKCFENVGITLLTGIEFTTKEGVHIIGVHSNIQSLQKPTGYYSVHNIISKLLEIGATIIVPHPFHVTGIISNGQVSDDDINYCFANANFVEVSNYKYGSNECFQLLKQYPKLKTLVGSDAHSADAVAAQYNTFVLDGLNNVHDVTVLYNAYKSNISIEHIYRLKHSNGYWMVKKLKKGYIYQSLLKVIPTSLRKKLKNLLINK